MEIERVAHWFGPAGREQFGWWAAPTDGTARAGVLLCQPAGNEYKNARPTFRLLAEELARRGFATLRYDHPMTADSTGVPSADGMAGAWLEGVGTAAQALRATGCGEVVAVGMRLGATLLASSLEQIGPLAGLVLWDPCRSGRTFLREQRALRAVAAPNSEAADPEGMVEGPGSLLPAGLAAEVPWLEGTDLAPAGGVGATLVALREASRQRADLAAWLGGTPTTWSTALGQDGLLELPAPDQIVPAETLAEVTDWVDRLPVAPAGPVRAPGGAVLVVPAGDGTPGFTESVTSFGPGLFGIHTRPDGGAVGPVVVLVNVATDHHIGPGRLWVDVARRLAALGTRSLRVDLSGFGDSSSRAQGGDVLRSLESIDDICLAAHEAEPDDPRNVVLVGLCASAYQVLEAAMQLRPAGVCGLNPALEFLPPEMEDGGPMDLRRRFCIPPSRVVSTARTVPVLGAVKDHFPNLTWRLRHLFHGVNDPADRFSQLVAEGVDTLLVCNPYEAMALRQSSPRTFATLETTGAFHLETVPELDHSLEALEYRVRAYDLIVRHVLDRFTARVPAPATPERPVERDHAG